MVVELLQLDYVYTSLDNLNPTKRNFIRVLLLSLNIYIHIYIHIKI